MPPAVINGERPALSKGTEDFPVRFKSILPPQDLKYRGEDRASPSAGATSSASSSPSIAAPLAAAARQRSATITCSWPTPTSPTTATSGTTASSATPPRSPATSRSRTTPPSAPVRPCTSSAGSAATLHRRLHGRDHGRAAIRAVVATAPARIYGLDPVGPMRRGFSEETIGQLERAYRFLLHRSWTPPRPCCASTGSDARLEEVPTCWTSSGRRSAVHPRPWRGPERSDDAGGQLTRRMKLGLIAGNGQFPVPGARRRPVEGHEVTVVADRGGDLRRDRSGRRRQRTAASVHWMSLGQLGGMAGVS